jgi:DNA-binding PadR family transcriptional regulator
LEWGLSRKGRQEVLRVRKKIQELSDTISDYETGLELIDREMLKTRGSIGRAVRLADKVNQRLRDEKERTSPPRPPIIPFPLNS